MTKREIVVKIAAEMAHLKQADVMKVVQKTLDSIIDSLTAGENVELRNFGIFKIKSRKAKRGRNPRTGAEVPVPEHKAVCFKPGLVMKQRVK
ncbi:MAG: integration host factor subunit beta [Candidatus Omnitrophica bacterium]|nr:integration host factor subunit beta [Candidatus Omnitrophota bacterium]